MQFIALIAILTIFGWMGLTRLIRGQVLSLREREFIQAAQVMGVPTRRILFKELLPNLVAPDRGRDVAGPAGASSPPRPACPSSASASPAIPRSGQTIADAQQYWDALPALPLGPGPHDHVVLVIALNLLGDSIRDAFDPETRR